MKAIMTGFMDTRRVVVALAILLLLFVSSVGIRHLVLGNTFLTTLSKAPPLANALAPSLASPSKKKSLPLANKDFRIISTNYFDNQQWVVATVTHIPDGNGATLVLRNINGIYTVVLGPGTQFSPSVAESLPPDVATYLTSKGLLV